MTKWTIGRRIAAGYAVLILLLVALVIVGTLALRSSRDDFTSALTTVETRAIKGTDALQGGDAFVVAFLSYLLRGNEPALEAMTERFDAARDATVQLRDSSTTPAQVSGWTEAVRQLDALNAAAQQAIEAKGAGRDEEATRLYSEAVIPVRQAQRNLVVELVDAERKRASESAASASDTSRTSIWLLLGVSVAAVILGILIAWGMARAVTSHLRDAVATLAATSTEILAATAQQASGAAEEETAIHQTTTTADEVRQTVALTTEKARAVAKDVRETAEISREGRRAVDESVRGTQEARTRMETLAERILALSEQAQAIGEILRTVNGLAEQSNLLASTRASRPPRPATPVAGSRSSRSRSSRWPSSRARRSGRSARSSARSRPRRRPP